MNRGLEVDIGHSTEEIHNYINEQTKKIAREIVGIKIQNSKVSWLPNETKTRAEEKKGAYLKRIQPKSVEHHNECVKLKNSLKYEIRNLKDGRKSVQN